MRYSGTIEIEGLQELRARLLELPRAVRNRVATNALHQGAGITRRRARALAPVDTGFLSESIIQYGVRKSEHEYDAQVRIGIQRRATGKRVSFKKLLAGIKRGGGSETEQTTRYWYFHEFGTSRMQAHPFMRPGFDETKTDAAFRIKDAIRLGIENVVKAMK